MRRVEGSACAAPASHSAVDAGPKDDEIRRAIRTDGNPMDTGLKDLLADGTLGSLQADPDPWPG